MAPARAYHPFMTTHTRLAVLIASPLAALVLFLFQATAGIGR